MTRRVGHVVLKALVLPLVVFGVLAMHQLLLPHGPDRHAPSAPAAVTSAAPGTGVPPTAGEPATTAAPHHDSEQPRGCCGTEPASSGTAMLHMCLAVLVAGFVLTGTGRGWWRSPSRPTASRTHLTGRPTGLTRVLPWTVPTVYALRVLRL